MPDTRTGNVFSDIFTVMFQTEQWYDKKADKVIWDFSNCKYFHPFYLGALAVLKHQYGRSVEISGIPTSFENYFHNVSFRSPLEVTAQHPSISWDGGSVGFISPVCIFHPYDSTSLYAQEYIQKTIKRHMTLSSVIHSVVSLLLSELIDNITEHSKSKEGFVFCHTDACQESLYMMICDSGRSIYSSYSADSRYNSDLTDQESSGILMALCGKSTKDRPESENRGYGISKSRNLIVEGFKGEF